MVGMKALKLRNLGFDVTGLKLPIEVAPKSGLFWLSFRNEGIDNGIKLANYQQG